MVLYYLLGVTSVKLSVGGFGTVEAANAMHDNAWLRGSWVNETVFVYFAVE